MEKNELFSIFKNYVTSNIISDFSDENSKLFEKYFDELIEWNQKFNLISCKSETDLIYRHFCDSLYSAKAMKELRNDFEGVKVMDLGTGSGMPGIPVKIVLPGINLTLVESITKKCTFLENVKQKLDSDMTILNLRAEDVGHSPNYRQRCDFVLSRAVSKFSPNLEIAVPLLKVGGYFIVHKTKQSAENPEEGLPSVQNALSQLGAKFEKSISYRLPEQELDYCILIFKKVKGTPQQYPRKVGIPEKKPL